MVRLWLRHTARGLIGFDPVSRAVEDWGHLLAQPLGVIGSVQLTAVAEDQRGYLWFTGRTPDLRELMPLAERIRCSRRARLFLGSFPVTRLQSAPGG